MKITEEILKKNGFEYLGCFSKRKSYLWFKELENGYRQEIIVNEVPDKNLWYIHIANHVTNLLESAILHTDTVERLQLAIDLCLIDKKIVY